MDNVTPIKGPGMKNDKYLHYKIYYFNVIPPTLSEEIINNTTIKDSCYPKIIDTENLKLCPEGNYGPLYV